MIRQESFDRHGRHDEALANAQQGHRAFPAALELTHDLARRYEGLGRVAEAQALHNQHPG